MRAGTRAARLPLLLATVLLLASCSADASPTPRTDCPTAAPDTAEAAQILDGVDHVTLTTNKGEFSVDILSDSAPIAAANFVALVRCGFYDGLSFHRVIPGFLAQVGDPQTRDDHGEFAQLGTGGPGYRFEVELPPEGTTYRKYMVALANAMQYDQQTGEILGNTDTNGSQIFVMLGDAPALRPYYSVLGQVGQGTDVVDAIGQVPTSEGDVPLDPVIIQSAQVDPPASGS